MKKKIIVIAIVVAAGGLVYLMSGTWDKNGDDRVSQPSTKPVKSVSTVSDKMPVVNTGSPNQVISLDREINPLKLGGIPYKTRIAEIISNHPDIIISEETAVKIQELYTKHSLARIRFEVGIADINQEAGKSKVGIPSYPVEGKGFLESLINDIKGLNSEEISKLTPLVAHSFSGDNNNLGKYPQKYTITVSSDASRFDITKEVIILNEQTGAVVGVSKSSNQVTNISGSIYEGYDSFFPK